VSKACDFDALRVETGRRNAKEGSDAERKLLSFMKGNNWTLENFKLTVEALDMREKTEML